LGLPLKLDIGAGNDPQEGYMAVDAFGNPDVQADMWALPFDDDTIDEIRSAHALEHISKFQVVPTLWEWRRVLRSGGRLDLQVPDLEWCVKRWLQTKRDGWDMAILFGSQTQDGGQTIHPGEFHKTGFTEALMLEYLNRAGFMVSGFERIWTHEQETMRFVCVKP
jgi:predicted SAM-dependent methyltransferase